jgi:N-acetylmuramoyl-L-alanine amidase
MTPDEIIDGLTDRRAVALTVWGEARGEGVTGMMAVACVIRNRALHPKVRWWGTGWKGVCLHPFQFSVWNEKDPNRRLLLSIAQGSPLPNGPMSVTMATAMSITHDLMEGKLPDVTNSADHYHTLDVRPPWKDDSKVVARHGAHIFYRLHP